NLFDLDNDSFLSICLRAVSSLSRNGFRMISPALVRRVNLARSPQQVLDFCAFCLKHGLCPRIISFSVSESAIQSHNPLNDLTTNRNSTPDSGHQIYREDNSEVASALTKVLKLSTNLAHLTFNNCTDLLLEGEPHIADLAHILLLITTERKNKPSKPLYPIQPIRSKRFLSDTPYHRAFDQTIHHHFISPASDISPCSAFLSISSK
ncbi:hypothetical protein CPB84DRAFT_1794686, partial [Gymnopilus junonius]